MGDDETDELVDVETELLLDTLWPVLTDIVVDSESVRLDNDVLVARTLADGEPDVDREKVEDAVTDELIDVETETLLDPL